MLKPKPTPIPTAKFAQRRLLREGDARIWARSRRRGCAAAQFFRWRRLWGSVCWASGERCSAGPQCTVRKSGWSLSTVEHKMVSCVSVCALGGRRGALSLVRGPRAPPGTPAWAARAAELFSRDVPCDVRLCVRAPPSHAQEKWYSRAHRETTDTEVLVLALLLGTYYDQDAVSEWAREVIPHASTFVIGAAWKPTTREWAAAKQQIQSMFRTFVLAPGRERVQTVEEAVALFDGNGRLGCSLTEGAITGYLGELMAAEERALLGLGGGATAKKGAPLRRTYILPRVARLLHEQYAQLRHALAAGFEQCTDAARAVGSKKTVRSASKKELKRKITEKENAVDDLNDALRKEVRGVAKPRALNWISREIVCTHTPYCERARKHTAHTHH